MVCEILLHVGGRSLFGISFSEDVNEYDNGNEKIRIEDGVI